MKADLDLIAELSALNVAYWQDVDHNWGRRAQILRRGQCGLHHSGQAVGGSGSHP